MQMRVLFILVFVALSSMSKASLDSLYEASKTASTTSKQAEILMNLGIKLEYIDVDSALNTYEQAKLLALEAKDYLLAGKVCLNKSFGYYYGKQDADKAIAICQEAIPYYERANHDTGLIQSYYNIGFYSSAKNDYASAIINYKKALEFEGKVQHDPMFGKIYYNLGFVYQELGAVERVIENTLKAIEIKKRIGDPT